MQSLKKNLMLKALELCQYLSSHYEFGFYPFYHFLSNIDESTFQSLKLHDSNPTSTDIVKQALHAEIM